MKILITESQNNRIWLLRRYNLVEDSFNETIEYVNSCKFNSFEDYERRFVYYMMDDLHQYYYEFDNFDYNGVMEELKDMFYVELTEIYYGSDC